MGLACMQAIRTGAMKKQKLKYNLKDILAIVISWLFALSLLYLVYLKIKTFYH